MSQNNTFEESIKQLEEIISKLEDQSTPLDEAMMLFEKGVALSADCSKKLEVAKQAVHVLIEKNGQISKEEFLADEE